MTSEREGVRGFRKRPVVIEAMQLAGSAGEIHAVYQWIERNTLGSFEPMARIEGREPWPASGVSIDPRDGRLIIATLEGGHWADLGDWIIRGVQGEFYPCKPDIFAATYEPADAAPPPAGAEQRALELLSDAERGPINDYGMVPRRVAHAAIEAALSQTRNPESLRELVAQAHDHSLDGEHRECRELLHEVMAALAQQPEAKLAREQPCGCVICVCEDEKQCHGCGARHCGNRTDHPAYVEQQPEARGVVRHDLCGCPNGRAEHSPSCAALTGERNA